MSSDIDDQEYAFRDQLGIENAKFSRNRFTEFTGSLVQGLIVYDRHYGVLRVSSPCTTGRRKKRVTVPISNSLILMDGAERQLGHTVGFLQAYATRYQNDPRAFAAAINSFVRPGIQVNWHFFDRPLFTPESPATAGLITAQTLDVRTQEELLNVMSTLSRSGFQRNVQLDLVGEGGSHASVASIFFVNAQDTTARINYRGNLNELYWEIYFREGPNQLWQKSNQAYDHYWLGPNEAPSFYAARRLYGDANVKLVSC